MNDIVVKTGDLHPSVEATVTIDGKPVDLSGPEVISHFTMTRIGEETPVILRAPATIPFPEAGRVVYNWQPGDTDEAGEYVAELVVAWQNGATKMTLPPNGYLKVRITESLS